MDTKTLKRELEKRLKNPYRTFTFDRQKDQLRIENVRTGKGISVSLPGIIAKWHEQKETAIDEVVYFVEEGLQAMEGPVKLFGQESKIFPVIRSTSFPKVTEDNIQFVVDEHTAETRIYYALDSGKSYRLIDVDLMNREGWTHNQIREIAMLNGRALPISFKEDHVAGNSFYFVRSNDGYDASRILNLDFLEEMSKKITGAFVVAVPHQDVLLIADIRNDTGYDILQQMTMSFFASGRVPITALSFLYENGELEPIFILGENKKKKK